MLARNIQERLEQALNRFPVVVILGARQSGKTTLARMARPDWSYFDLERGSHFDLITRDFDFFFQEYSNRLIIDEAQLSGDLFRELRGVVDADRMHKGRFLLTGSSSADLHRHVSESLAGRVAVIELGTLKMNERYGLPLSPLYTTLDSLPVDRHLTELKQLPLPMDTGKVLDHFLKGGYPEPMIEDDADFQADWMAQYQAAYLQRDVRDLYPGLNIENYRRFITMLSELSGTIINRSEIGRTLSVSESAVRDYLDIAQGTFLWRNLPSLERTASKSLVKMPRGYLRDSGLLHHLVRVRDREQMLTRPGTGAAFEGYIIEELIQGLHAIATAPWTYSFYRTRGGAEVDLVLTSPKGDRIPVEIKFGAATRAGDLRSLTRFIEQERTPYGIVINNADQVRMLTERIIQLPAGAL